MRYYVLKHKPKQGIMFVIKPASHWEAIWSQQGNKETTIITH